MNKGIILLEVILVLGIVLFLSSKNDENIKLVNSNDFEELLDDDDVFVLQAHVPYMGEIEGTNLVMEDWDNPEMYSDVLPEDKTKPIGVYCRSGRMSALTAEKLSEMGYSNVYDLEGGMNAWTQSGRSLVNVPDN